MEEDCSDEDSSLKDYWKKNAESKKKSKKKREKKKKKKERKGKEEADGTDQESESTLDGTLLDPTKLTTLTSRNENPLGNLPQDSNSNRTSLNLEEAPSSSQQNNSSLAFQNDDAESIQLSDFDNLSTDGSISPSPPRTTTGAEDIDMEGEPPIKSRGSRNTRNNWHTCTNSKQQRKHFNRSRTSHLIRPSRNSGFFGRHFSTSISVPSSRKSSRWTYLTR
jgi:hypothetical protein